MREKAKKFQKFVLGLKEKYPQALPEPERPLLERFIFYLLFYSNGAAAARKVIKGLTDDREYTSWNEVRVAPVRQIAAVLSDAKIEHADFMARLMKQFLQKVFEECDETALEPLKEYKVEKARKFVGELPEQLKEKFPPWGATYLLTGLGIENQLPWDPMTEAAFNAQKVFPTKGKADRKKIVKEMLTGLDGLGPLEVHHLLVEHERQEGAGKKR